MPAGLEPQWTSAIITNHRTSPGNSSVNSTSELRFVFWRPLEWRFLPPFLNNSGDPKQPEVCDHDFIGVVENVLRLQVFVNNAFSVQVAHSLCRKNKQRRSVKRCCYIRRGCWRLRCSQKKKKNYLYNLLSDLSRLINIQSVFSVSNNWIQCPPFTETVGREKNKDLIED